MKRQPGRDGLFVAHVRRIVADHARDAEAFTGNADRRSSPAYKLALVTEAIEILRGVRVVLQRRCGR
jgi:hypothetical protein